MLLLTASFRSERIENNSSSAAVWQISRHCKMKLIALELIQHARPLFDAQTGAAKVQLAFGTKCAHFPSPVAPAAPLPLIRRMFSLISSHAIGARARDVVALRAGRLRRRLPAHAAGAGRLRHAGAHQASIHQVTELNILPATTIDDFAGWAVWIGVAVAGAPDCPESRSVPRPVHWRMVMGTRQAQWHWYRDAHGPHSQSVRPPSPPRVHPQHDARRGENPNNATHLHHSTNQVLHVPIGVASLLPCVQVCSLVGAAELPHAMVAQHTARILSVLASSFQQVHMRRTRWWVVHR